jgi:frataxin
MSLRRVSRLASRLARVPIRDAPATPATASIGAVVPTHLAPWSRVASHHGLAIARGVSIHSRGPTPLSHGLRTKHHANASTPVCSFSTDSEDVVFHRAADEMLGNLQDRVEAWGEESSLGDFDFSAESGVVTIGLGDEHGAYVINKQAPNRQIWMSSPVSGPVRYDYDSQRKEWIYARDGSTLKDRLRVELIEIGGGELDLTNLNE